MIIQKGQMCLVNLDDDHNNRDGFEKVLECASDTDITQAQHAPFWLYSDESEPGSVYVMRIKEVYTPEINPEHYV